MTPWPTWYVSVTLKLRLLCWDDYLPSFVKMPEDWGGKWESTGNLEILKALTGQNWARSWSCSSFMHLYSTISKSFFLKCWRNGRKCKGFQMRKLREGWSLSGYSLHISLLFYATLNISSSHSIHLSPEKLTSMEWKASDFGQDLPETNRDFNR